MKKINVFVMAALLVLSIFSGLVNAEAGDVKDISISLVNIDPDPALVGDVVEIRIGIENTGGAPAENLIVEIEPEYPFSAVTGESLVQEAGTIKAYQYESDLKIVKFKVRVDRDATAGTYELKVKEYEKGKSSTAAISTFNVDIDSKESAEVIYIDQVELIPGKITPLKFTINNVGSAPLRELSFQWENEDDIILPVGSDNTKYIKYIDIGDSAELEFDVIASGNADPDLYKLDLKLTYDDPTTGEEKEINTKAGVYVGGSTDFDAAYSGSANGETSFSISNIGSVSASSVTVKIPDQKGWRVTGSNSVIIGNLNEGDYTIASFTLQQTGQGMGMQNSGTGTRQRPADSDAQTQKTATREDAKIDLEIVYTDSRGNRKTITKEVAVDSTGAAGSSTDRAAMMKQMRKQRNPLNQLWNTGKWILAGILLLVLFVLVHKKKKKGKQENPDYTYMMAIKDLFRFKKKQKKVKK